MQPESLTADSRLYLIPTAFVAGSNADRLCDRGQAGRLADGPLAFTHWDIRARGRGGITWGGETRTMLPVGEFGTWADRLPAAHAARVNHLLANAQAPRRHPAGGSYVRPLIMGVINVTPDSFSDGGQHVDPAQAVAHATEMEDAGADILDIGAESSRPGAAQIEVQVELDRLCPVLDRLIEASWPNRRPLLSVDTRRAAVMEAAVASGVDLINDISALTHDPDALTVAAGSGAHVVLMHMQGDPETMNRDPTYDDVVLDVFDFLEQRIAACEAAGIPRRRLIVDPGIGFGKRSAHNLALLRHVALLHGLGCPILLGVSRKGLTGDHERGFTPKQRLPGTLAATTYALGQGVQLFRAHDVAATRQAIDIWHRIAAE